MVIKYIPPSQLVPGDVLIDNLSVLSATDIYHGTTDIDKKILSDASTLLESLVLFDRIIVDKLMAIIN